MRTYLKRIGLQNFKAVAQSEVELDQLTLLVGPNSAGKSTLLQALLLHTQAAASGVGGDTFPLNGSRVRLGSFSDVLWAGSSRSMAPAEVQIRGELVVQPDPEDAASSRSLPATSYRWDLSFTEPGSETSSAMHIREATVSAGPADAALDRSMVLWVKESEPDGDRWDLFAATPWITQQPLGWVVDVQGSVQVSGDVSTVAAVEFTGGLPRRVLVERPLAPLLSERWTEALLDVVQRSRATRRATGESSDQLMRQIDNLERRLEDARRRGGSAQTVDRLQDRINDLWQALFQAEETVEDAVGQFDLLRDLLSDWMQEDQTRILLDDAYADARSTFSGYIAERLDAMSNPAMLEQVPARVLSGLARSVAASPSRDLRSRSALAEHEFPELITSEVDVLLDYFQNAVRYLGPLRMAPRAVHPQVPNPQGGDLGDLGENTAAVIHACQQRLVENPLREGGTDLVPLVHALDYWLSYLSLGSAVDTDDQGRLGISLTIVPKSAGRPVDLTAVGVGVSQVLPVMTLCLLSDPGDLIILEQPELHLHPATQQLLADFFLACARSGRQLLVETHSDHLVSRVRRRIAEDRTGAVKELASIVFAEQRPDEGTVYRTIEVTDYGSVEQWPEGFFDQAATEAQAILKEAVARRKETRAAAEDTE